MESIFANAINNYTSYFLFRHWRTRADIESPGSFKERKIAEKSISLHVKKELADNKSDFKDEFRLLGIPEEIIDFIISYLGLKSDPNLKIDNKEQKRSKPDGKLLEVDLEDNKEIIIPHKEIISKELPDMKEEEKNTVIKLTTFISIKIID